jgi:hypothetical protein
MLWIAASGFLLGSGSAYAGDASSTRGEDLVRPEYDDVSYGGIPQATFGAAAAPAAETVADGHDDVSYGAAPHASFALELPTAEQTVALGHDDVTYPTAEPRRPSEAAVATSGDEARTSVESRVVARIQTTDEARALAGENLPAGEAPRPVPPGTVAQTTDDARALAGRMLPRGPETSIGTIEAIGTTDEAREVAGGLLVVTPPSRSDQVACGESIDCPHRG